MRTKKNLMLLEEGAALPSGVVEALLHLRARLPDDCVAKILEGCVRPESRACDRCGATVLELREEAALVRGRVSTWTCERGGTLRVDGAVVPVLVDDDEDAVELHGPVGVWRGERSVTRHTRVRCMGRVYANTKRYLAMPRPYRVIGREARCEACFFGAE